MFAAFRQSCVAAPLRQARTESLITSCAARAFSTAIGSRPPPPAVYVSDSHDPWFNLAFEDWIFRKTDPQQVVLYLYRNDPCVVIGRNQNPWKEIDLHRLKSLGIPFVRRMSGGGTVYHDLGNTNYCVFVPRTSFERRTNAELVARALVRAKVPAFVNERNDICVQSYKVSGSAFKLVNKRAYHHGTMLIDAQLSNLRGVLGTNKETMVTKGVASVPSPVRNIAEWSKGFDHDQFVKVVADEFANVYGGIGGPIRVDERELSRNAHARDLAATMQTWDWMYGQTPEFTHEISGTGEQFGDIKIKIDSRHGLITAAELLSAPKDAAWAVRAKELVASLEGDRYGSLDKTEERVKQLVGLGGRDKMNVLLDWLKREM